MELLREELSRITGSMHCLDIKGEARRAACSIAVYSVPTPAAAEADPSAFFSKFILEQLEEMSRKLDRLEESLQREGRWRRSGYLRCHRCQQPGHIEMHCRAPAPIRAGRRQTSVVASSAPECDARDSAVPTAALELDKRPSRVDRKVVLSLTVSSSDAAAVSQASSNKPRGQCRRSRQRSASPRSSDEMPDPEDPETGCVTVSCRRPTNTVPRVEPVRQSIAASAIRDALEHEPARCISPGESENLTYLP